MKIVILHVQTVQMATEKGKGEFYMQNIAICQQNHKQNYEVTRIVLYASSMVFKQQYWTIH